MSNSDAAHVIEKLADIITWRGLTGADALTAFRNARGLSAQGERVKDRYDLMRTDLMDFVRQYL